MSDNRAAFSGAAVQSSVVRALDIILASVGLLLAAPVFAVIAVFIKLDSRGPVFFPAPRVGKDKKLFSMYKFRSMLDCSGVIDQSICPLQDPRVTTLGRILRRTKLNELPQLFNILRGEMSFVGPRPEAPDLAEMYPEGAQRIFSVKPGLVGPVAITSLRGAVSGRNEDELFPPGVDPVKYYIEHIVPEKVKIDLHYLTRQTVGTYFKFILAAVKETVFGALSARRVDRSKRQIYLFLADFVLSQVTYAFAYRLYIRAAGLVPSFKVYMGGLLLVLIVRPVFFHVSGLYRIVMELITSRDILRVFQAVGLGSLLLVGLNTFQLTGSFPVLLALFDFALLSGLLTAVRLVLMVRFHERGGAPAVDPRPRVIIYGANRGGLDALRALGGSRNSPYRVVGFIDDAEDKYAKKIHGVEVLGNRFHIGALALLHNVQEVILAPDDTTRGRVDEVVALCAQAGIRSRIFSSDADEERTGRRLYRVRAPQLSDMLPDVEVQVDEALLRPILTGKTTLMLGSGGELGSAVCRQIFRLGCRKLVIAERYESRLSRLMAELMRDLPGFEMVPVVLDSGDTGALDRAFEVHRPGIVLHAGMRKFIPFNKTSDEEVARSNYTGTFNLAKAAARHGCEYFLVISSINAVRRGSFISESLRVAEMSLSRIFGPTPTRLVVNRVGNIIENSGGIVSWLNEQILQRKPIPMPAGTPRAFLLSKNAGARSILQSLAIGSRISPGGLLLTSEPGISLEYEEIARKIAGFYGLQPGFDISVDLDEIPDALLDDEPSALVEAGDPQSAVDLEDCLKSERVREVIQRLISIDPGRISEREWYRQTKEILALCGPAKSPEKKPLSSQN